MTSIVLKDLIYVMVQRALRSPHQVPPDEIRAEVERAITDHGGLVDCPCKRGYVVRDGRCHYCLEERP